MLSEDFFAPVVPEVARRTVGTPALNSLFPSDVKQCVNVLSFPHQPSQSCDSISYLNTSPFNSGIKTSDSASPVAGSLAKSAIGSKLHPVMCRGGIPRLSSFGVAVGSFL